MSDQLFARLLEGSDVTHLFAPPEHYPGRLTARCGAAFWSGDVEWLDYVPGPRCAACVCAVSCSCSP